MKTIEIAGIIEQTMVDLLADNLDKYITVTDFGIQLNDENEQVYRSHLSIKINATQDTPVDACKGASNPVQVRRFSDMERINLLARQLLGLTE